MTQLRLLPRGAGCCCCFSFSSPSAASPASDSAASAAAANDDDAAANDDDGDVGDAALAHAPPRFPQPPAGEFSRTGAASSP